MKRKLGYDHTIHAAYIGYITQAIVNNFVPLLFITFAKRFTLTLSQIALITTVNFTVQLAVDLLSAKYVDKIGYRRSVIGAHLFAAAGLIGLTAFPALFGNAYLGILVSVMLYAVGGGLIEVLISPIVEACPTERKEAAMSLLHSFYCWGCVMVVLGSTAFFRFFGIEHWRTLALLWALVPAGNAIYFSKVPIYEINAAGQQNSWHSLLGQRIFWIFLVLMVCAGAAELAMSQWASAFAETALHVSKTVGDLAGPCAFAILMGTARALYGKFSEKLALKPAVMISAILCMISYLMTGLSQNAILGLVACALCGFSVGIFWPGFFSMAAKDMPHISTAMYAIMALAGDVGCSLGPTIVGFMANAFGKNLKIGFLTATIFPVMILISIYLLQKQLRTASAPQKR